MISYLNLSLNCYFRPVFVNECQLHDHLCILHRTCSVCRPTFVFSPVLCFRWQLYRSFIACLHVFWVVLFMFCLCSALCLCRDEFLLVMLEAFTWRLASVGTFSKRCRFTRAEANSNAFQLYLTHICVYYNG